MSTETVPRLRVQRVPDIPSDTPWPEMPMSKIAESYYRETYLPRILQRQQEVDDTPLSILVWGPGSPKARLYGKRTDVRNKLRQLGHAAVFSEEIDEDINLRDISTKARELIQAMEADFIVIIQDSPGSIAEAHDFAGFVQSIGSKMLIFIDREYQAGYSFMGALYELNILYHNVETFIFPDDIVKCHLVGKVKEKVKVLQWTKWRLKLR
jgi:hypothetical protein